VPRHFLTAGEGEAFQLVQAVANTMAARPLGRSSAIRFVMYGEWLYAKHTIYSTNCRRTSWNSTFLDMQIGEFLSTARAPRTPRGTSRGAVRVLFEGVSD